MDDGTGVISCTCWKNPVAEQKSLSGNIWICGCFSLTVFTVLLTCACLLLEISNYFLILKRGRIILRCLVCFSWHWYWFSFVIIIENTVLRSLCWQDNQTVLVPAWLIKSAVWNWKHQRSFCSCPWCDFPTMAKEDCEKMFAANGCVSQSPSTHPRHLWLFCL